MLPLLVKNGNSVLFGVTLSSEQFEVNIAHSIFLAEEGYKEATLETHEELQGADESYWTIFPVKFTE